MVRALMQQLPHESLIYFGDTARVPYGPKSPETVRRYASQIADWLVEQGVKAIVVACNTATAHALELLHRTQPVPVIGVIEPGARAAVRASRNGPVGVIGTAGTIASGAYERAIHAIAPMLDVRAVACPLFVPLVEEGWTAHDATRLVIHEYLAPLRAAHVDTLVLGCTHYPMLANALRLEMGPDVVLIDSAAETAAETSRVLQQQVLRCEDAQPPRYRIAVSDAPARFLPLGRQFLDVPIAQVEHIAFT